MLFQHRRKQVGTSLPRTEKREQSERPADNPEQCACCRRQQIQCFFSNPAETNALNNTYVLPETGTNQPTRLHMRACFQAATFMSAMSAT